MLQISSQKQQYTNRLGTAETKSNLKVKQITISKLLVSLLAMFFCSFGIKAQDEQTIISPEQNPQWIFFKDSIPKNKSIVISGKDWELIINDKYKVSFTGTYSSSNSEYEDLYNSSYKKNATFNGFGFVLWNNDHMQIKLTTYASGSYDYNYTKYKMVTKVNGGKAALNAASVLWGNGTTVNATETEKVLDYTRSDYASGSNTINNTYSLSYGSDGKINLEGSAINLTMTGNITQNVSMQLGGSYSPKIVAKNESELNNSSKDEFGEWSWNKDRSKIYLKSSLGNNLFVIWNNNGKLSWSMEMEKGTKGVSESATENNDKIINIALAFDGAPTQIFSFVEYKSSPKKDTVTDYKTVKIQVNDSITRDSTYAVTKEITILDENDKFILNNTDTTKVLLDYATYNRFMGTLTKNSASILNQIKDKQMLMLQYKVNNEEKFDMFILEGLLTILNYINQ